MYSRFGILNRIVFSFSLNNDKRKFRKENRVTIIDISIISVAFTVSNKCLHFRSSAQRYHQIIYHHFSLIYEIVLGAVQQIDAKSKQKSQKKSEDTNVAMWCGEMRKKTNHLHWLSSFFTCGYVLICFSLSLSNHIRFVCLELVPRATTSTTKNWRKSEKKTVW